MVAIKRFQKVDEKVEALEKELRQIKKKLNHNNKVFVDRLDFVYEKAINKDFNLSFEEFLKNR